MTTRNATPKVRAESADDAPYIDYDRNYRDCVLLDAIKAAMQLLDDDTTSRQMVRSVLSLARDHLEAGAQIAFQKARQLRLAEAAEVAHG